MDVLTPDQRQKNMQAIRARGTKLERIIGRGLHARGFRYRLNVRQLPGTPDFVFPKHRAVIFAHGCFWHGHDCHLFKVPGTRPDFWMTKIRANQWRDELVLDQLHENGWRTMIVWECASRGRKKHRLHDILQKCEDFLLGDSLLEELKCKPEAPRATQSTNEQIPNLY